MADFIVYGVPGSPYVRAALLALEVCKKAGLSVPKDVKVAGIDNIPQARFASPSLTTYRQPLDEMAGCAVDLALGRRTRSRSFDAVLVPAEVPRLHRDAHHQQSAGDQPNGLRRDVEAAGDDRVGVGGNRR